MKKFWVATVGVSSIAILGFIMSPYFIGRGVQQEIKNTEYASLNLNNYHRHWFSSDATLKISSPILEKSISMNATIDHGPWVTAYNDNGERNLHFARGSILLTQNTANLNGKSSTLYKLSGDTDTHSDIKNASFNINSHDADIKVTLQGLKNRIQMNKDATQYTSNTALQSALVAFTKHKKSTFQFSPTFNVNIQNVQASAKSKKVLGHIWTGVSAAKIEKITLSMGGVTLLDVNNTGITGDTALSPNKKINANMQLNIDSLNVYPLVLEIKPIQLQLSASGIDANGLNTLMQGIGAMQHNLQQESNTQAAVNKLPAAYADAKANIDSGLIAIVQSGFTLNLKKIHIGMPDNKSNINASLRIILQPLAQQIANATKQSTVTQDQVHSFMRDAVLRAMTGVQPQAGSTAATQNTAIQNQVASAAMQTMRNALVIDGNVSLPRSLVETLLKDKYQKDLAKLAARGEMITNTPDSLTQKAITALIQHKLLQPGPNNTLTMILHFSKGAMTINGQRVSPDTLNNIPVPDPLHDYQTRKHHP